MTVCSYFSYIYFSPIFTASEVIISYGLHSFDICSKNPSLWQFIKVSYMYFSIFSFFIFGNLIFSFLYKFIVYIKDIFSNKHLLSYTQKDLVVTNPNSLRLKIGKTDQHEIIYLPEKALFQNFLITGTIGSGKTSSAMYPFTKQLLEYSANVEKIGMLILDVKGNYSEYVSELCNDFDLSKDFIEISLHSNITYNPLDKPYLKPLVLANRLKTILLLFSENNSESFWLDKAEQVLCECIKLCRLYNSNYVTFLELHKLIFYPNYYKEKLEYIKNLFLDNKLKNHQIYDLNSCIDFFQKDFENLDQRTLAILKSEIGRITNTFISDFDVLKTFSPKKHEISFKGFRNVIEKGKIVVLSMNIAEYRNLSTMIAAYLKLDFQTEVLSHLSKNNIYKSAFICDEYDKYASKIDGEFFSLSREAKCINIISTQSYSSLKNVLKDESSVKVIIQNLINKIWFRTDDIYTIEEAQKQLGREEKTLTSKSISENAKETKYNFITNSLNSEFSNISESYSTYLQKDFSYDTNFFTQDLETFSALTFLSDGNKIIKPCKLSMLPYFRKEI